MTDENFSTVILKILVRPDEVDEVIGQLAEFAEITGLTVVHLADQATTPAEFSTAQHAGAFGDTDDQNDEADDGGDHV